MTESVTNFSAETDFKVNTFDIDIAGHVNNTVYLNWIEILRTKLFDELCGFSNILSGKYYPVVVSTNIEYKNQIKIFDKPKGIIKISRLKYGVFSLEIEITVNGKIAAKAAQRCVIIDLVSEKMIKDEALKNLLIKTERPAENVLL
jgi:acyl-CoA thioester hydrolase